QARLVGLLDLLHPLGILRERLATDHQVVRVEQVPQQRDRLAEHSGTLGQQLFGLLVPAARYLQQIGHGGARPVAAGRQDAAAAGGGRRSRPAAASTASSLTVDSSRPEPPSSSDWAGRLVIVPGPLAGLCTR